MQSLLNVPAEVVSANINAAVAKAAAKKRRIFELKLTKEKAQELQLELEHGISKFHIFLVFVCFRSTVTKL